MTAPLTGGSDPETIMPTPDSGGSGATAELRGRGALVRPEDACRCESICDREGDDAIVCRFCRFHIDPVYAPCPRLGFGCGHGCDCCTPEQQEAASV